MSVSLRDAGAIVLLRPDEEAEVFWAERAMAAAFLGGYRAFVGGKVEAADVDLPVVGSAAGDQARVAAVAAVRELFEETGVLVARLAGPVAAGRLAAARAGLLAGQAFGEVLGALGAHLDLGLLRPAGRWVTPPFAPRRFDTHFFLAELPPGQEPQLGEAGELTAGVWETPRAALGRWQRAEALVPPPVLHILRTLASGATGEDLERRLVDPPTARGAAIHRIEFLPGIVLVPLVTDTLPPAHHTNCFVLGRERAVIVDPGTADEGEIGCLLAVLEDLAGEGVRPVEIVLSHHHRDHVGGAAPLAARLGLPIAAHPETARRLEPGAIAVNRTVGEGERWDLGDGQELVALHLPGHAAGHLNFHERRTRALLTADNVVGLGTVLIDPEEGDMDEYLASLRRLEQVDARALFGAHGPALADPGPRIRALIAHRRWREGEILHALAAGPLELGELVTRAYGDTRTELRPLAERQALAHLRSLERHGRTRRDGRRIALA